MRKICRGRSWGIVVYSHLILYECLSAVAGTHIRAFANGARAGRTQA